MTDTREYKYMLSVVIVNYNVRHFLEQCLYSVRKASAGISCEVHVVDNNSADGSCAMVSDSFPEVRLIRNPGNLGFAAACNQAIRISSAKYILLLNPDTVVEEDTFAKCIRFMETNAGAGATGVKMINGNGKFLPESRRAFPTPAAAFFKMTGISKLFPGSRYFNRYYLGHLDHSSTTEAEILSGAFMFIRSEVLVKTGLLDESYFMYGEDIDLSYRIVKAGYKNYYFPEAKIIHYKGESTKKGDLNYVLHFYRAMLIFTSRHYGKKEESGMRLILRSAIFFSGFAAIMRNLGEKYLLPLTDTFLITLSFLSVIRIWAGVKFGAGYHYPVLFSLLLVPSFILSGLISVLITGGYRRPSRIMDPAKGIALATVFILGAYALLPAELRFSRAVIIFGAGLSLGLIILSRLIYALAGLKMVDNRLNKPVRAVIVGTHSGYEGIIALLDGLKPRYEVAGRVSISIDDLRKEVLGHTDQIGEIIRINRIREVIFSTREISASRIIEIMQVLSGKNVTIRISPPGEKVLIGSNSINLRE